MNNSDKLSSILLLNFRFLFILIDASKTKILDLVV